jgi:DNA repair exonuclease SbcCD ATPase subunit
MTTIIYTLGNGYRCSCCGSSWTEEEDFDDDASEQEIIDRMSDIGSRAEDWQGIHRIFDYSDDTDELEKKIEDAIEKKKELNELSDKIDRLKTSRKDIDDWFENLEKTKVEKTTQREKINNDLAELETKLNQLKGE